MSDRMEPPEPACGRCQNYVHDEDRYHCPSCGKDLIEDCITEDLIYFCKECDETFNIDDLRWHCSHCTNTDEPQYCVACDKILSPKQDCLCEECKMTEHREQEEYLEDYVSFNYNEGDGDG